MLNFYRLNQDYLRFDGNDRLDLIGRLSTNQVTTLKKYNGMKTILTTDKGRFVDLLTLYDFGDFIFSTCSFNNSKNVLDHLEKYTIMDDFKVADMSSTHKTILFYGENSEKLSKEVFCIDPEGLIHNDFSLCIDDDHHAIIAKNDDEFSGIYFIYAAKDNEYWNQKIFSQNNINAFGLNEISAGDYEIIRIRNGIPAFGKEMSDLTNPLECGLNRYVSFTKGCYIGQEVIARLDAYDKINKHMVGIKSDNTISTAEEPGDVKITIDNKECGFVTSAAIDDTKNIGLGFVKTVSLDYNKNYQIKHKGSYTDCKITKLPII